MEGRNAGIEKKSCNLSCCEIATNKSNQLGIMEGQKQRERMCKRHPHPFLLALLAIDKSFHCVLILGDTATLNGVTTMRDSTDTAHEDLENLNHK